MASTLKRDQRKFDTGEIGRLPPEFKRAAMKVKYIFGDGVDCSRFDEGEKLDGRWSYLLAVLVVVAARELSR